MTSKRLHWLCVSLCLLTLGLACRTSAASDPPVATPSAGQMALIASIKRGDASYVQHLLEQGVDPNTREMVTPKPTAADTADSRTPYPGDTALIAAVHTKNARIVGLLLAKGADVNGRGLYGYTALIESVREGSAALSRQLLARGANPNLENDSGDTALVFAANVGDLASMRLLLWKGAKVNGGSGDTPLMAALSGIGAEPVRFLLRHGADPNLRRNDLTALERARAPGHEEALRLLLHAGAKGRPQAEVEKQQAKLLQAFVAAEKAEATRPGKDRFLTDEDRLAIETVLLDMLQYHGRDLSFLPEHGATIVLPDKTADGRWMTSDGQMNAELDEAQAESVTPGIRRNLQQRNGPPISLAGFKPKSPKIVAGARVSWSWQNPFEKQYPAARCYAQPCLPGYSARGDEAVVRFGFGPTPHGATGTFLLRKREGKWHVEWRHFAFFA